MIAFGCALSAATIPAAANAFEYAEHKQIVCAALEKICAPGALSLAEPTRKLLCTAQCPKTGATQVHSGSALTPLQCVGLADLTALAGDHLESPLDIWDKSCIELHALTLSLTYYLQLAHENASHFFPESEKYYQLWHKFALRQAAVAGSASGEERADLLDDALTYEAFALHFLTDQFASGHRRVDRRHLHDFAARRQHDLDNESGLPAVDPYSTAEPRIYLLMGDGHLAVGSGPQWQAATDTAAHSICAVLTSFGAEGSYCAAPAQPHLPELLPFRKYSAYQGTAKLMVGGSGFASILPPPGVLGASVFVDVVVPWWPIAELEVAYAPTLSVLRSDSGVVDLSQATVHRWEMGGNVRLSKPNLDIVFGARLAVTRQGSQTVLLPMPTVDAGMDLWFYRAFVGYRVGVGEYDVGGSRSIRVLEQLDLGWGFF